MRAWPWVALRREPAAGGAEGPRAALGVCGRAPPPRARRQREPPFQREQPAAQRLPPRIHVRAARPGNLRAGAEAGAAAGRAGGPRAERRAERRPSAALRAPRRAGFGAVHAGQEALTAGRAGPRAAGDGGGCRRAGARRRRRRDGGGFLRRGGGREEPAPRPLSAPSRPLAQVGRAARPCAAAGCRLSCPARPGPARCPRRGAAGRAARGARRGAAAPQRRGEAAGSGRAGRQAGSVARLRRPPPAPPPAQRRRPREMVTHEARGEDHG